MEKRRPVFLFLGVLVCLLIVPTSATSGHVVSPGAIVRGLVSNQPDSAKLNQEGIAQKGVAWVWSSEIRLDIKGGHTSNSYIKGVTFILEGNANAIATLRMQEGKEYRELTSLMLNGRRQYFRLSDWVPIPQNPTYFLLEIGYKGKQGEVVPKVRVIALAKEIRVDSPSHGGEQEVDAEIDVIPWPGKKDTITLE